MPITKSAKKALRQSEARRVRNIKKRKGLKDLLKKVRLLIFGKKAKEAKELMPEVQKILDKSAKTNLIKENKARRIKSRMEKAIVKIQK